MMTDLRLFSWPVTHGIGLERLKRNDNRIVIHSYTALWSPAIHIEKQPLSFEYDVL